ncbi:MAG TPA: tetratricopeptide repeat protein [Thermoanaerobaculia bacterium]|nr:tetratricopeptide repeat protein [Thermoanaerobaculia bacterium]
MPGKHPDPQILERFMRNEAGTQERRAVILHLLTGCAQCVAVTRRLWSLADAPPERAGEGDATYGRMLDDLARRGSRRQRRARADREAAPRRLAELRELSPSQRRQKIMAARRFHTPAVCELLIEQSRGTREAEGAAEWAGLAVATAELLDVQRVGPTLVRSFLARAWGRLGDARRRMGDPEGAEEALATAAKELAEGTDALDRAELQELQAQLLAERERLDDAECLLGRTLALYRALGERHLEGRVLILAAGVRFRKGGEEAARETIARLREGLARLDEDREPALAAAAFHRLTRLLAEAGPREQVWAALNRARALYERLADTPNLIRLRRLEGTLAAALGSLEVAEVSFRVAMRDSLLAGLGREAARALLDLALLYARLDRAADLQRLAGELHSICRVPDVGLSVTSALLFFRRLVETGFATPDVLFEVALFLGDSPKAQRAAWAWEG